MPVRRTSFLWVAAAAVAPVLVAGCDSGAQDSAVSATPATPSTPPTRSAKPYPGSLAACKVDVATVSTAEEAFYAVHSAYSTRASIRGDLVPELLRAWPTSTTITYTRTSDGFSVTGTNHGAVC